MASYENFTGITGQKYPYLICDVNLSWNPVPANYCLARIEGVGYWVPLYFGETNNLATRMSGHNKLVLAATYGATHILAHINLDGEAARKAEEKDLIRAYNPPCNIQHNPFAQAATRTPLGLFGLGRALNRGKK